jgi:hypothetical protein
MRCEILMVCEMDVRTPDMYMVKQGFVADVERQTETRVKGLRHVEDTPQFMFVRDKEIRVRHGNIGRYSGTKRQDNE